MMTSLKILVQRTLGLLISGKIGTVCQASVNSNSHISGFSNDKDTAEGFAKYFSSVYFDSAAVHLAKVDFENLYSSFYTANPNDTVGTCEASRFDSISNRTSDSGSDS